MPSNCAPFAFILFASYIFLPVNSFKTFLTHKPSLNTSPFAKDARLKASFSDYLVRNEDRSNGYYDSTIFVIDTKNNNEEMPYNDPINLPPPPPSESNPDDDFYREMRKKWPIWVQNSVIRDSGLLRAISDKFLTTLAIAGLIKQHPHLLLQYIHTTLTQTKIISYGSHPYQTIDIIEYPSTNEAISNDKNEKENLDLIVFVHGGGWGTGRPWIYRLAASAFVNHNTHVAVFGYRTFPDGDLQDQVQDIDDAFSKIIDKRYKHVTIIGHSTGAHISLLMIMKRIKQQIQEFQNIKSNIELPNLDQDLLGKIGIDTFVGLGGPYDIPSHLEYEKGRGVDEISPLLPTCGNTYENLLKSSPAVVWKSLIDGNTGNSIIDSLNKFIHIPKMIFVHGIEDNIVPYTATTSVFNELIKTGSSIDKNKFICQALLLKDVGHADFIIDLMLNGPSKAVIFDWLTKTRINNGQRIENQIN